MAHICKRMIWLRIALLMPLLLLAACSTSSSHVAVEGSYSAHIEAGH